jgi:hypothetical protein
MTGIGDDAGDAAQGAPVAAESAVERRHAADAEQQAERSDEPFPLLRAALERRDEKRDGERR